MSFIVTISALLLHSFLLQAATLDDLYCAIHEKRVEDAKNLINNDPSVRAAINTPHDHNRGTVFHRVADQGLIELVEPLLNAGADYTLTNRFGDTPLHVAFDRRNASGANTLGIVNLLLTRFPGLINQPDSAGASLLRRAMANDRELGTVKLLVEQYSAPITSEDIAFARRRGFNVIAQYLEAEMPRQQARFAQARNLSAMAQQHAQQRTAQSSGWLGWLTGWGGSGN